MILTYKLVFPDTVFYKKAQCYNVKTVESYIIKQQYSIKYRQVLITNQIYPTICNMFV